MGGDNTLIFIAYAVMPVASLWFFFVAFRRKYRDTSQWIRSVNLILAIIGLIWMVLSAVYGVPVLGRGSRRDGVPVFAWKARSS